MSAVPPRCGDGSAWLYHGSQALVSRLEPKATRGVGPARDRLRAVYASHEKSFAAAFALPLVPDARGRLEWSLQFTREPHITIHAGALDTHRVGYLYRVPADRFVPLDDLQWVSYRSVAPHDYRVLDTATYARWIGSRRKATSNPLTEPKPSSSIDFDRLWRHVVANMTGPTPSLHGPDHWRRVEHNGMTLAAQTGADLDLVRLFALFHDSQRQNDRADPGHGARGAEYASKLRGVLFDLSDDRFELLRIACTWHTDHMHHEHPTIATCWDADRLDLGRVGMVPDARFMSSDAGRERAAAPRDRVVRARSGRRPHRANWLATYGGC